MGFLCGSDGKESAYSAGDPDSIPGWEDSPGEQIGYPLQSSCLKTMDRGAWRAAVHGVAESRARLSNSHFPLGSTYWKIIKYFVFLLL